jgi:PleD family two-component response regulator
MGKELAIPRHLMLVLEDGDVVIQRGPSVVERLMTREQRLFNDFDDYHNISDGELQSLVEIGRVASFDDNTVWILHVETLRELSYYFLDTKLPPTTLKMVNLLLETAHLNDRYGARNRMGRVAIMTANGDPFSHLADAEAALTLVKQALGAELVELSIESIRINPRADETQTAAPIRADLIRETPATTLADRSVLLIDAEEQEVEDLQLVLENLGVQVNIVSSGEQALDVILDQEPDLLVMSLGLEDMHGYELIARIRRDPVIAETPIIIMGALNTEADVTFALNVAKVEDYLLKPINPKVLRHRVLTLLNRLA